MDEILNKTEESIRIIEAIGTTHVGNNKKELISISVYEDVMIDVLEVNNIKLQLAKLLNTTIENITIELGYNDSVVF